MLSNVGGHKSCKPNTKPAELFNYVNAMGDLGRRSSTKKIAHDVQTPFPPIFSLIAFNVPCCVSSKGAVKLQSCSIVSIVSKLWALVGNKGVEASGLLDFCWD
eukprot:5690560-Amphidinium_carterae.1